MGNTKFTSIGPLTPLEVIVGLSSVARGTYLIVSHHTGSEVPAPPNGISDIIFAIIFIVFGVVLLLGSFCDEIFSRLTGLFVVAGLSIFIAGRALTTDTTVIVSISNSLVAALATWLFVAAIMESRE